MIQTLLFLLLAPLAWAALAGGAFKKASRAEAQFVEGLLVCGVAAFILHTWCPRSLLPVFYIVILVLLGFTYGLSWPRVRCLRRIGGAVIALLALVSLALQVAVHRTQRVAADDRHYILLALGLFTAILVATSGIQWLRGYRRPFLTLIVAASIAVYLAELSFLPPYRFLTQGGPILALLLAIAVIIFGLCVGLFPRSMSGAAAFALCCSMASQVMSSTSSGRSLWLPIALLLAVVVGAVAFKLTTPPPPPKPQPTAEDLRLLALAKKEPWLAKAAHWLGLVNLPEMIRRREQAAAEAVAQDTPGR